MLTNTEMFHTRLVCNFHTQGSNTYIKRDRFMRDGRKLEAAVEGKVVWLEHTCLKLVVQPCNGQTDLLKLVLGENRLRHNNQGAGFIQNNANNIYVSFLFML